MTIQYASPARPVCCAKDERVANRTPHPDLKYNLGLIGGRGCGKTSIAKRLARCNRNFMLFSLDSLIRYESRADTIAEIVRREGWQGFRDLEYVVTKRASAFEGGALIDCGGGVVVDLDASGHEIFSQRKVDALRRHGLLVYLKRDTEYLLSRVGKDPNRPALSQSESFEQIMARRHPWYERAADIVLECGNRHKEDLAEEILAWFYQRNEIA